MKKLKIIGICVAMSALFITSCKKDDDTYDNHSSPLMQSMHKMSANMDAMQMTGDPDHDFAMMMMMHHEGAIEMTNYEIANGNDTMIKNMAQMMKNAQMMEMAELDSFTKAHTPTGNNMNFMNAAEQAMDKMDTEADKQQLNGDSDHDFAHLIIPHHQSAIEMAQAELQYGQVQMMKDMAQMMINDQQKEINELKEWLNTND